MWSAAIIMVLNRIIEINSLGFMKTQMDEMDWKILEAIASHRTVVGLGIGISYTEYGDRLLSLQELGLLDLSYSNVASLTPKGRQALRDRKK
jgi:hypothetical protein